MAAVASQPSDVAIGIRTCPVCVRAHALSEPRSRPRLARGHAAGASDPPSRLGIMAGIASPLWSRCRACRPGALEACHPPHVAHAGLGGCSDCARTLDPVPWCGARHDDLRTQRLLRRGPTYAIELRLLWPARALMQSLFLLVVWLHAMVGLHHWLRIKPWYQAWGPPFLVLAVLVPTLALTGWIEGARRVALMHFEAPPLSGALLAARAHLIDRA